MATIFLIEGPVGAGKSTFAATISQQHAAPRLNLDEWMAVLFSPDRPDTNFMDWYLERKQRCIEQIWNITCDVIDTGTSAVLELGLIQRQDREDFYARVDAAGHALKVYVLDAPEAVRRERVARRNADQGTTFKMAVSDEVFTLANRMWQAPDEDEMLARDIEMISTSQ